MLDVRDPEAVEGFATHVLAEHPKVDVVVNNVGDFRPLVRFRKSGPDSWRQMYETNLLHIFSVTHAFLESMIEGGGGAIVNVHSVEGMRGYPGNPSTAP